MAARISETVLHFWRPSDAAPTTSGIYFSNDNDEISFNSAVWLSAFKLVRRRLINAVFFFKLESKDPANLNTSTRQLCAEMGV